MFSAMRFMGMALSGGSTTACFKWVPGPRGSHCSLEYNVYPREHICSCDGALPTGVRRATGPSGYRQYSSVQHGASSCREPDRT
ncbi:hypothetical protein HOY80DRAFT_950732, partial [Tuber brumale]